MSNLRVSLSKIIIIIATISVIALMGCSSDFAASMRKVTYPPDFKYTEQTNLRTDMGKLALQMSLLDQALNKPIEKTISEVELQREQVLNALRNMSVIAAKLKTGANGANHPFMDDYMQDFIRKVDKARTAASLEQPRYYFAGKVAGGCTSCHKINR